MMSQGLQLMVVGMGVVFAFLSIMVVCMYVMSALVASYSKFFPEAKKEIAGVIKCPGQDEIAAVIAAVKHFK